MEKAKSLEMIRALSNAYGASGFEDEVVQVGRRYGEGLAELAEDSIRNLFFYRKGNTGRRPVVLIDGHSDEVSFMVQAIRPGGTLQFIPLGGWVDYAVPAHKVRIRNADGVYIPAVVATKPPHFMTAEERGRGMPIANMVLDVGASSAQEVAEVFNIRVGAPVVPDVCWEYNPANDVMLGKAFDCRLGCASVVETLDRLAGQALSVDVVGSFSTQEEVGTRGALVAAQRVKPDIAIVFEGSPADDTFTPDYAIQTALGHGPMLRHIDARMITNPRFLRYALDVGTEMGLSVQESVRSGGSTNGAPIHTSNLSVPVIVMGLPVRYIHTHHGFASYRDFDQSVALAVEIIKRLNQNIIASF